VTGIQLPHRRHNTQATSASMRFWARSVGERNPRFTDEAYCGDTGATFVAHPCWLYSVQDTIVPSQPDGRLPVIAGTDWTFDRPVVMGDRLTTRATLREERRLHTRFAGPAALQRVEVSYHDERGSRVASAISTLFLVDPAQARERGRHAGWKRYRYTETELAAIEAANDAEQVQGATPRYLEDVRDGSELPAIVRGPMSSEEAVLFVGATRPCLGASAFARERRAGRVPGFLHPVSGIWETYSAGLVDDPSARQMGFPAAHDLGLDRIAQMATLATNWMGDSGQLLAMKSRLLAPHMLGDTSWLRATAAVQGETTSRPGNVALSIKCSNQRGEVTATAQAIVQLPSRGQA
jgi:acyl dehydratase